MKKESRKCLKCGEELPEDAETTMHLKCAQSFLKSTLPGGKDKQAER